MSDNDFLKEFGKNLGRERLHEASDADWAKLATSLDAQDRSRRRRRQMLAWAFPLVATAASCDNRRLIVLLILQALLTTVALAMNAAGQMDHAFWWFAPAVLGIWGVLGLFFRQTGHKR